VFLFDDLIEVPQLRRTTHIVRLHRIVNGLQILECLGCTLELFILPLLPGQHAVSDDGVFNILMDGLVNVFEHFYGFVDDLVLELVVAVVLPDPVPAQLLYFEFVFGLLLFFFLLVEGDLAHFGLEFGVLGGAEVVVGAAGTHVQHSAVDWLRLFIAQVGGSQKFHVLLLLLPDPLLLVLMEPHPLYGLESDEPRH